MDGQPGVTPRVTGGVSVHNLTCVQRLKCPMVKSLTPAQMVPTVPVVLQEFRCTSTVMSLEFLQSNSPHTQVAVGVHPGGRESVDEIRFTIDC